MRSERDFDGLVARSLNDHWSVGGRGSIDSSTFDNFAIRTFVGPAIEYNLFPYSQYTRRQLRTGYALVRTTRGTVRKRCCSRCLTAKIQQELTLTLDQREPWGSLQAEVEYSTFIPDVSLYRLQLEGEVNVRLARGLSLASRARLAGSAISCRFPRRGVTAEEVLLRLRRLRSGYDYNLQIGLTYTFGSIFNTIVNPRFGNLRGGR